MKWIVDCAGLAVERPCFDLEELDRSCEQIVTGFLIVRHGEPRFPMTTEDLQDLIRERVSELDVHADLSGARPRVEGETTVDPNGRITIRISSTLSECPSAEKRFRTTLAHELGHALCHAQLTPRSQANAGAGGALILGRCDSEAILGAKQYDWREWQANYVSGAILMPVSYVQRLVQATEVFKGDAYVLDPQSVAGHYLIRRIAAAFQVSQDAARIRLEQQHVLAMSGSRRISRRLDRRN